ncbi:terminase small subunit [Amphibacillus sp. MSJ-3]|uniref:terminase small subunit n=1 Tax=Amphibacillus sp. MSJ-3 TaxID=2841505 RepID=UPI001C0F3087|nr:terminase small subunit [Amphibacillus sp. MSJ-3]MBU5594904.1 terminase small subunit [Amphibacillus sp. MSJ-3]
MSKTKKLSLKQQKFADEYIITGNIEQSALKAGYSKSYARAQSHKLLANVGIKSYIDNRLAEIESEKIADQKEILEFLTNVLRGEAEGTELVGMGKGAQSPEQLPPTVADKTKAAELLGKRYAMWTEKVDQTNTNIEINVGEWDDD